MKTLEKKVTLKWLFLLPLMMLFSCQGHKANDSRQYLRDNQTTQTTLTPQVSSEMQLQMEQGAVLTEMRDLYRLVRQSTMDNAGGSMGDMFDRMYCSKSWNKMLMAVRAKESETCSYFFEIDHWTMMRDPQVVSFDEFEIHSFSVVDSVKTASIKFTAFGNDSYTPAIIDLVCEDGRWVIDNFRDLKYKVNVRESMTQFLRKEERI